MLAGGRAPSAVMGKLAGAAAAASLLTWPPAIAVARPWRSPWGSHVSPERVANALALLLADTVSQAGQLPYRLTGPRVTRGVPTDRAVPDGGGPAAGWPGHRSRVLPSVLPGPAGHGGNTGTPAMAYRRPGRGALPGRPAAVPEGQMDWAPARPASRSVSSTAAAGAPAPPSAQPLTGHGIRRDRPSGQPASQAGAHSAGNGTARPPGLPVIPPAASSPEARPAPSVPTGHASAARQPLAGARGLGELLQRWESGSNAVPARPGHPAGALADAAPAQAAIPAWDLAERRIPAGLGTAWPPDAADTGPAAGPMPGRWPDRLLDDAVEMALELLLDREAERHGLRGGAP